MKPIKQSVVNTFKRVGIDYENIDNTTVGYSARNIFTGEEVKTTALIVYLINWVYATSLKYENGDYSVKVSDFDRIRYFVLEQDQNAYSTCLD